MFAGWSFQWKQCFVDQEENQCPLWQALVLCLQSSTQASSQSALSILPISRHRILKVVYSRAQSQWNLFLLLHQGSSSVTLTYFVSVSVCLDRTQHSLGLLPCFLPECPQFHPLWFFNHQMLSWWYQHWPGRVSGTLGRVQGPHWKSSTDNKTYYTYNFFRSYNEASLVKNLPANAGDTGSIPGLGRSPVPQSD